MGNFVTTGSRVSENGEGGVLGDLNNGSDEKLMEIVNDSGPIEDCVMSEVASSLVNMKQDFKDKFEEEEEENGFHVGDFVWVEEGNCHQCWPGKIYDSSDASELALKKRMQDGELLVAYFGNEDFAWCKPSQLKPFMENFKEFSKMSDSRSFIRAVEEAVGEIGEHVERFLGCDEALVSSLAVNSGVKEGVVVPDVRREVVLSLVLEKSGIVLADVKSLAMTVSFSDLLEIEVLKRKISAFYRSKGRSDLAEYDEYGYIIGLEDKEDEESFDKSSCQISLKRCSGFAWKKRKCRDEVGDVATTGSTTLRRRVSEVSKIENTDLKTVEETSHGKRALTPRKRKNKRGLDDDDGIERREESNDSNHLEESEKKEDLSTPLVSLSKRVKVDVSPSVESNNENGETILQTGKRERKKSKYLSPEYLTDFSPRARKNKIGSESSQIREAERMTKNAIDYERLGATRSEEMLDLIREAALGTQDYSSSCDMVKEFVSVYRSFTYHDGDNNKIHKKDISAAMKQEEVEKDKREAEKQISGAELIITTDIGSTLPSKEDLIKTYKMFGALDKERSYMFNNNSSARIVFLNVTKGEEAFHKSLEECPFATTSSVTFKLNYLSSESLENPNEKIETESRNRKGVMEIECLKEKLEEIRSLLDQSKGKITEELKMKLEDESRNLLDKVSKITVPSS